MQSEQQQRIMGYFIEEAKDHLETIEKGLLNLQGTIGDPELISEVFRAAHSVKGGAAMLGLDSIQQTSHRLEDYFKVLKECPITVDQKLETLFLRVFDTLQDLLEQLQGPFGLTQEKSTEMMGAVEPIFGQLHSHLNGLVMTAGGAPLEAAPAPAPVAPVVEKAVSAPSSEDALKTFFNVTVSEQLRRLLALFKQADTEDSRQQLHGVCQSLLTDSEALGAPESWQHIVLLSQKAIAYPENRYSQLAPVVIKLLNEAKVLGLAQRGGEIAPNAALLDLQPPDESGDATQDDALMDALLADASRDAEQVLDTVLDDSLTDGSLALDSSTLDSDVLDLGADSSADNGAGALDLSRALDDLNGDALGQDSEALDDDISDLFGVESSESQASDDVALADSFDLLDSLDSSSAESGDVDLLFDELEDTAESDSQVGPQVGPDEMDSLADLFSGDSDNLNLDWDDAANSDGDELSDDLALDSTSDFSDLLFDAGDEDEDLSQDLASDDDDISTLLNTLEMDDDASDDAELATTPLSVSSEVEVAEETRAVAIDDSTMSDADEISALDGQNLSQPSASGLDNLGAFFSGDENVELGGEPEADALALDSELSSEEFDELFVGLESEETVFEQVLPESDEDDQEQYPNAQETPETQEQSESVFDDDFVGDVSTPADVMDDPESGGLEDLWADHSSDAEAAARLAEADDDSALGVSESVLGLDTTEDLFDTSIPESNDSVEEAVPLNDLPDEPQALSDSLDSESDGDVLDNLFGSSADETEDVWGESVSSTDSLSSEQSVPHHEQSSTVDVSPDAPSEAGRGDEIGLGIFDGDSNADSSGDEMMQSLGLGEDSLFEPEADGADDINALFGDAGDSEEASTVPELEDGVAADALGLDLMDFGAADFDEAPAMEDSGDSSNPPQDSMDDMLGDIFDQGVGSEPIITDHDLPPMTAAAEAGEMSLEDMFTQDVVDDASIDLALSSNSELSSDAASEGEQGLDVEPNVAVSSDADVMMADLGLDFSSDAGSTDHDNAPSAEDSFGSSLSDLDMILDYSSSSQEAADDGGFGAEMLTEDAVDQSLESYVGETVEAVETTDPFDDLDAFLDAESETSLDVANDQALSDEALDVSALDAFSSTNDFADLDALLSETPEMGAALVADLGGGDDDFADLEKLLADADQSLGGPSTTAADASSAPSSSAQRGPARRGLSNQTMRVSVKNLDNLNNLVGELVVNRNSLEQSQERLRQFLDNLLYQVQQLSDVGQRMRDLYERSLLESSLLSSRRGYQPIIPGDKTSASDTSHATGASFDALEMDRFTGFHTLSQEMIELIVRVRESASDIDFVVDESDQVTRMFRQVTTQLQEGLTRTRMVPFAQAADRLPRAVRDISIKCGKQAKLVVEGRDTLIDKMILEQLYDPMTHLVNNAITHGIESPEARVEKGKNPVGVITIRTFHQGNQTIISVTDDGGGIDPDIVSSKAIEKGLITTGDAEDMSRLDIYDLLFHHGFSTRDKADDFAGRGVGMDVVRTSLGEIRGVVNIDSTIDQGTTFTIRLPLTLSISKALLCVSNRARIAFPMDGVEDMLDVPQDRIQSDSEGRPSIMWRDILLPFRPLSDLLKFHRSLGRGSVYGGGPEDDVISVVVLRSAGNYLALQVDQVLGEQEIVIKQLEAPIPKPAGIAGATVLGDGRIMPIADVLELIDLSMGRIRRDAGSLLWEQSETSPPTDAATASEPTVLIVDDSITVRELLSMTFNKVGYRVEQARDGQEAWEKLRSGLPCDLVFCDIEMPRMDGLELLSRLQKDAHFSELPIAMLTSRGADRHRQMAVQLGAKGYFTKPYLEEALLDAAQRMLKGEVLVSAEG